MSHRPVRLLIEDMLERIERVERAIAGMDRSAFLGDEKTLDSVVRNLEVIGEAAARLPQGFREEHPEIPWRQIVGLRNRVVHKYFDVDNQLVWEIAVGELIELKTQLTVLREMRGEE